MSYEGYTQNLCSSVNGAHFFCAAETYGNEDIKCNYCGSPPGWTNSVDETNCDSYGFMDNDLINTLLVTPQVTETCNLGCLHITSPAIYRIPSETETKALRDEADRRWSEKNKIEEDKELIQEWSAVDGDGLNEKE
jgi:hypothetical protein